MGNFPKPTPFYNVKDKHINKKSIIDSPLRPPLLFRCHLNHRGNNLLFLQHHLQGPSFRCKISQNLAKSNHIFFSHIVDVYFSSQSFTFIAASIQRTFFVISSILHLNIFSQSSPCLIGTDLVTMLNNCSMSSFLLLKTPAFSTASGNLSGDAVAKTTFIDYD